MVKFRQLLVLLKVSFTPEMRLFTSHWRVSRRPPPFPTPSSSSSSSVYKSYIKLVCPALSLSSLSPILFYSKRHVKAW